MYTREYCSQRHLNIRKYQFTVVKAVFLCVVEAVPIVHPASIHVYYVYVIQMQERDRLRQMLEREGIATGIHYPLPLHLQPACAQYDYTREMFSETEAVAERIVSLPLYPELTGEQIKTVVTAIKKYY